jgi:hypothetical protein
MGTVEGYTYTDDGCELAPSCLRCPLPRCKHDTPQHWHRGAITKPEKIRDVLMALGEMTMTRAEVAAHFKLSERTVYRIQSRGR